MKKIFICFSVVFVFLTMFGVVEAQSTCPAIAPYQCNNGSCVNNASLCDQSWGGGLSNTTSSGGQSAYGSGTTAMTSTQVCTGDVNNNISDAENCAKLAQSQAIAKGYTASCTVEKNSNPLGNTIYFPVCNINGSSGHGAILLAGYNSSNGSSINPGWATLSTEIGHFTQTGSLQPTNTPKTSVIPVMTTAIPNGTRTGANTQTSTLVRDQLNKIELDIKNIQEKISNVYYRSIYNYFNDYNNTAATPNPKVTEILNSIKQTQSSAFTGTTSGSNNQSGNNPSNNQGGAGSCYVFTRTMQNGATGPEVLKLIEALSKAGFLKTTPLPSVFNFSVDSAVRAYQEANKAEILTPLSLNSGTGIVSERTRASLNKQCLVTNDFVDNTPTSNIDQNNMAFRYLKVSSTDRYWIGFHEVEVYDKSGQKIPAINVSATSANGAYLATNATDGNYGTMWNAGETNPNCIEAYGPECPTSDRSASITLDLGSVKNVGRIRVVEGTSSIAKVTNLSISNDNSNYQFLTQFKPPVSEGEYLEYPVSNINLPAPQIGGQLMAFNLNTPFSEERDKLWNVYPAIAKNLSLNSSGQTEITVNANTSSKVGDRVVYLWRVENADYVKVDKSISVDSSLGSISTNYLNSGVCEQNAIYDHSIFPRFSASQGDISMEPLMILKKDFLSPTATYAVQASPSDCNVGKVFTSTFTAYQKATGKTATYKFIIKVK